MTLEEGRKLRPGDRVVYNRSSGISRILKIQRENDGYLVIEVVKHRITKQYDFNGGFTHENLSIYVKDAGFDLSFEDLERYKEKPWSYERDY
jgi:hypothetical protein